MNNEAYPEQMVASSAGAIGSSVRGRDVGDVARLRQTLHRWRAQYGAMEADDTRRFQDFDRENAQLKDGGRGRAHQVDAEGDRREEILTRTVTPAPSSCCARFGVPEQGTSRVDTSAGDGNVPYDLENKAQA